MLRILITILPLILFSFSAELAHAAGADGCVNLGTTFGDPEGVYKTVIFRQQGCSRVFVTFNDSNFEDATAGTAQQDILVDGMTAYSDMWGVAPKSVVVYSYEWNDNLNASVLAGRYFQYPNSSGARIPLPGNVQIFFWIGATGHLQMATRSDIQTDTPKTFDFAPQPDPNGDSQPPTLAQYVSQYPSVWKGKMGSGLFASSCEVVFSPASGTQPATIMIQKNASKQWGPDSFDSTPPDQIFYSAGYGLHLLKGDAETVEYDISADLLNGFPVAVSYWKQSYPEWGAPTDEYVICENLIAQ